MERLRSVLLAFLGVTLTVAAAGQPTAHPRVALVFDDGPHPGQTEGFLAILAREQVRATFSHVGQNVVAHPELAKTVASAGHEINNHTYTHPHFTNLDDAAIRREVNDTQAAILAATARAPRWFWGPYGDWDARIAAAVSSTGMEPFPTNRFNYISSEDWRPETTADSILRNATNNIKDRTIILCHEWRAETLAMLPAIIAELKRQGCVFLTFSELEALTGAPEAITGKVRPSATTLATFASRVLQRPRPATQCAGRRRPTFGSAWSPSCEADRSIISKSLPST